MTRSTTRLSLALATLVALLLGASTASALTLSFKASFPSTYSGALSNAGLKFYNANGQFIGACAPTAAPVVTSGATSFSCNVSGRLAGATLVTLSSPQLTQSMSVEIVGVYSLGLESVTSTRKGLLSVDVTSDEPTMVDTTGDGLVFVDVTSDEPTMIDITSDEPTMLELGGTSAWLNIGGLRPNWSAWGGTSVEPIINR
jgi:hypothetical protein